MKPILKFIPIFFLTLTFVACEDVLELAPTSIIGVETFFQNEDDARVAMAGTYVQFRNQFSYEIYAYGEMRAGTLYLGYNDDSGWWTAMYHDNSFTPVSPYPSWYGLYRTIHHANLIIQKVPDLDFSNEGEKNRIIAEAYAIRAFNYFTMLKTWGGVPIITEPTAGFKPGEQFIARSTEAELLSMIKNDVEMSLNLFPNDHMGRRNRWSRPSVLVLKGDIHLWSGQVMGGGEGDISTALIAFNNAVSAADVALLPDYDEIFRYHNKGNKEIFMAVHFRKDESSNVHMHFGTSTGRDPFGAITYVLDDGTLLQNSVMFPTGGQNRGAPAVWYQELHDMEDQRRTVSWLAINRLVGGELIPDHWVVPKFRGANFGANAREFFDDVIVYRYADVLLMIAEAKNALGQDPATEINLVRQRAFGDEFEGNEFVSGTQEENVDAIMMERLLELGFEGKLWWDMIRLDRAFDIAPGLQGRENEQHLLKWPINQDVLSQNDALIQNPGW